MLFKPQFSFQWGLSSSVHFIGLSCLFISEKQISINGSIHQLVLIIGFNVDSKTDTCGHFRGLVDTCGTGYNEVVPCRYELLKLNNHKGLSMKVVRRFTIQVRLVCTSERISR